MLWRRKPRRWGAEGFEGFVGAMREWCEEQAEQGLHDLDHEVKVALKF
jgi:hypothetical protein